MRPNQDNPKLHTQRMAQRSRDWEENRRQLAEWPEPEVMVAEVAKCMAKPSYFINQFCFVQDASHAATTAEEMDHAEKMSGLWVPFKLWPAQYKPLKILHEGNYSCMLKARQLGLTWLALAYANWTRLFVDGSTVLLFSRRDTEAIDLLTRMCGMFDRLPDWLKPSGSYDMRGRLLNKATHRWIGADGGKVLAFPCTAGDSYTASLVIVDEADLVPNLDQLLASVKPTIDAGGKLCLISRVDKSKPDSAFKNVYRGGRSGASSVKVCFLPWYARESRTLEWYEEQRRESLARTLTLDHLHEQYPATDDEALAPRQLDKRFPTAALELHSVFRDAPNLALEADRPTARWAREEETRSELPPADDLPHGVRIKLAGGAVVKHERGLEWVEVIVPCPEIPGLRVYGLPQPGRRVRLGSDPAQGLPGSNDSATVVTDIETGEELASFRGKYAPRVHARYDAALCDWYSAPPEADCRVNVERNNHGHAYILWWEQNRKEHKLKAQLCKGLDGHYGWNQTGVTKEIMYDRATERITDNRAIIHSRDVYDQVTDVEASTLEAPVGRLDDLAVAWGLSLAAADLRPGQKNWEVKTYG